MAAFRVDALRCEVSPPWHYTFFPSRGRLPSCFACGRCGAQRDCFTWLCLPRLWSFPRSLLVWFSDGVVQRDQFSQQNLLAFCRIRIAPERACIRIDFETRSLFSPSWLRWSHSYTFLSCILIPGESSPAPTAQAVARAHLYPPNELFPCFLLLVLALLSTWVSIAGDQAGVEAQLGFHRVRNPPLCSTDAGKNCSSAGESSFSPGILSLQRTEKSFCRWRGGGRPTNLRHLSAKRNPRGC